MKRHFRTGLFALLALLVFSGVFTGIQRALFVSPARLVTSLMEEQIRDYGVLLNTVSTLLSEFGRSGAFTAYQGYLEPVADSVQFGAFAVSAGSVAIHVINIFLIISVPVGAVLLGVLFILLAVIPFVERDRRLRNTAMAVGTAAWVFVVAMPLSVLLTGELTGIYTGALRFTTEHRLEEFIEKGDSILAGESIDPRQDMILLVKGNHNYVWFASGSWLLDAALLPVLLSWVLYRAGILIANTLFGSLGLQKLGETMKRVFEKASQSDSSM